MTARSLEILHRALALSDQERADLASSLLDSLDTNPDPEVGVLWQEEISRRASAIDSGVAKTIPWPELRSQVSAALKHGAKSVELHEDAAHEFLASVA